MYCYESTNITGEKVVNHHRMQLNDALIESHKKVENVIEAFPARSASSVMAPSPFLLIPFPGT